MIMCRELTEQEILEIHARLVDYEGVLNDPLDFAFELFKAAQVQQTQERETHG